MTKAVILDKIGDCSSISKIDPVLLKARAMLSESPEWQRRFMDEIVTSAITDDKTKLPKMLG